jgi:hypothetical protein
MLSIMLSSAADVVEPKLRAVIFSLLMAVMALAMAGSAVLGASLNAAWASKASVVTLICVAAATLVCVPGVSAGVALLPTVCPTVEARASHSGPTHATQRRCPANGPGACAAMLVATAGHCRDEQWWLRTTTQWMEL